VLQTELGILEKQVEEQGAIHVMFTLLKEHA
jgi:hypothetical protein